MRWGICKEVAYNSFDYFDKTLITDNGFREYDVRWLVGKEINPNGFVVLGRAYGTMMREILKEETVVIGHDFRSYSQDLCRSLIVGLLSTGVRVIDLGMVLTPMVYFAQYHFNCKAALMVTASHNENGWTGVKIAQGLSSTLGPEGILQFKEIVHGSSFISGSGSYEIFDGIFPLYLKDAVAGYRLARPLKLVLAAGNGTAGRFAPAVLRELGCEVVELDCNPDWDFKRYNPNPEDLTFLGSISETTMQHHAAVGIGIDGDGDRIGVVDDQGREVFSDKLGVLLARWICKLHPNRTLVIEPKCTGLFQTDAALRCAGVKVVVGKTGHSYMKAQVAREDAIAGFEKSGHWYLNHPYGRGYDDALVSSVHLLRMLDEAGLPLSQMVDSLPKTWQSPTLGAYCPDQSKYGVEQDMVHRYAAYQASGARIAGLRITDLITVSGVRVVLEDGSWGLIRASSNKPSLVVVAEGCTSEDELYAIVDHLRSELAKTGQVGEYDQEMPRGARAPAQ